MILDSKKSNVLISHIWLYIYSRALIISLPDKAVTKQVTKIMEA